MIPVLAELATHLLDHLPAHAPDRLHRERGEEERHEPADEEAGDHPRVLQGERDVEPFVGQAAPVLVEQDEGGEPGGADRVALRDRLRRVADSVQGVGDLRARTPAGRPSRRSRRRCP